MKDDFSNRTKVARHTHCDVIFGRGNGISSWPGNVAFRHIVWIYRPRYAESNHSGKRNIGLIVTLEVQRLNGRFLMLNPKTGHFHRVSEKRAQDKACQCLREKDVKMPLGFDLGAMASRKKWLQSIVDHHQSSEGRSSPKQTPSKQLTEGKTSSKQTPSKQLTEGKTSSKQTPSKQLTEGKSSSKQIPSKQLTERKSSPKQTPSKQLQERKSSPKQTPSKQLQERKSSPKQTPCKQLQERKSLSKQTLTTATANESRMTHTVAKIPQPVAVSRSGTQAISSSVLTTKHSSGAATYELGKQLWCCGDAQQDPVVVVQDNRTVHVEDLSNVILDQTAHSSSRPLSGASSLSNHSVNGYGDDNTVLFDSNHWPEQDDPAV